MNILHHKSWHVRTKRNIERVRRDEANAERIEKEKQRRVELAEQESRTELLRTKARGYATTANTTVVDGSTKHIDIFEDYGDKTGTVNKEHEKETKQEQELWEKKNNILTTLHKEEDSVTPWYLLSHHKRMNITDDKKSDTQTDTQYIKQLNQNKYYDPIETMNKYLNIMKTNKNSDKKEVDKHSDKKRDNKYERHSIHEKKLKTSSKTRTKSIEELRAERLSREKRERERERELLASLTQSANTRKDDTVIMDDRLRAYNSQFNPHIARQNDRKND